MTATAASPLHFTASLDTWTQPAEEPPLMAQYLLSPSMVPHKATRAAPPTRPKFCCLSSAALCTDRITSPCLYLAARKMWVKVGKCCPRWKGGALDINKSETFFTLCPSTVQSGATVRILASKWKKETVLLQSFWFHCWKAPPAATELVSWVPRWCMAVPDGKLQQQTWALGTNADTGFWTWLFLEPSQSGVWIFCFALSHLSIL